MKLVDAHYFFFPTVITGRNETSSHRCDKCRKYTSYDEQKIVEKYIMRFK